MIANINQGECSKVNLNMPYWNYEPFNLNNWTNDECWVDFRFQKDDLVNLIRTFELPPHIITYNRLKVDPTEETCLLFRRLAYPCRYTDLVAKFARPVPELCIIFNHMLDYFYNKFNHLLTTLNQEWLSADKLTTFAAAQ